MPGSGHRRVPAIVYPNPDRRRLHRLVDHSDPPVDHLVSVDLVPEGVGESVDDPACVVYHACG